jgi:adenylate kinase
MASAFFREGAQVYRRPVAAPVVLIIGPPGAGKGTQSVRLAERLGAAHLSSGQILRDTRDPAITSRLARGELALTDDFLRVVGEVLEAVPAYQPIVLDAVGRMLPEAEWLLATLDRLGRPLQRVIHLQLDEVEALERARRRGRADDEPGAQALRWQRFREETLPVLELYRGRGVVTEVDGSGSVDDVADRVARVLQLG